MKNEKIISVSTRSNFNTAISKNSDFYRWFIFVDSRNSWMKSQSFRSSKQIENKWDIRLELRTRPNRKDSVQVRNKSDPPPWIEFHCGNWKFAKGFRPSGSTFRAFIDRSWMRLRVGGRVKLDRDNPRNTCASRKACLLPATKVNQKI
mgnify:CR=1 FL=1